MLAPWLSNRGKVEPSDPPDRCSAGSWSPDGEASLHWSHRGQDRSLAARRHRVLAGNVRHCTCTRVGNDDSQQPEPSRVRLDDADPAVGVARREGLHAARDEDAARKRLDRHSRPRRHHGRRLHAQAPVPGRGRARLGQDDAGAAVPDGGRASRRAGALRHALGDRRGAAARSPSPTAGSSTASTIRELTPPEDALEPDEQNTMFHPSEVELASTTKLILDDVERLKPTRVVFDSLSELRLLAGSRAALPPADPRAEAVLRDPGLHGRPARRPDGDRPRPADAEHRARRRPARAAAIPSTAPSVAGCASSSTAACSFAAATTTTSSARAASRSSRAWSPPSTAGDDAARSSRAASPSSTPCWAAASRRARAR